MDQSTNKELATVTNQVIDLKDLSPTLRKIAATLLKSPEPITVSDACKLTTNSQGKSISRDYVYYAINKLKKKKGIDFNQFIKDAAKGLLNINRIGVYQALLKGAVEGSAAHIKLFAQITGDLEENTINTGITIKHLTIGINQLGTRPSDLSKEKGIIDLDPEIPKNKTGL